MCAQFSGAWPALVSPVTPEGDVNVKVLRDLTAYLLEKDVGGFYLCGSTGEGVFMSVPERKQVTEEAIAEIAGRVPVIVHVGSVATRDAVELAHHAQAAGADGVASILPPVGRGLESTYLHYEAIGAAVPDLPFLPYLFGGETDAVSLMRELLVRMPNVGGAKYTGPNMYEYKELVDLRDDNWTIFLGMDMQCAFGAMFGGSGNIGTTLNYHPGIYREIHKCVAQGDFVHARDLQVRANRVTLVIHKYGMFGAMRVAMQMLGFDIGPPRLPNPPLPEDKVAEVRQALEEVDFMEIAAM